MNSELKAKIVKIIQVANLEGWDTSQLQKHHDEIDKYPLESIEALALKYGALSDTAEKYLKLRARRSEEFWETCRIQNSTWLQEWVDLRNFTKTLKNRIVKRLKNGKAKVSDQSDTNQEDSE